MLCSKSTLIKEFQMRHLVLAIILLAISMSFLFSEIYPGSWQELSRIPSYLQGIWYSEDGGWALGVTSSSFRTGNIFYSYSKILRHNNNKLLLVLYHDTGMRVYLIERVNDRKIVCYDPACEQPSYLYKK